MHHRHVARKKIQTDLHEAKKALNSVIAELHRIEATLPSMTEDGDPQSVPMLERPWEGSTDAKTAIVSYPEAASDLLRELATELKCSFWGAIEAAQLNPFATVLPDAAETNA